MNFIFLITIRMTRARKIWVSLLSIYFLKCENILFKDTTLFHLHFPQDFYLLQLPVFIAGILRRRFCQKKICAWIEISRIVPLDKISGNDFYFWWLMVQDASIFHNVSYYFNKQCVTMLLFTIFLFMEVITFLLNNMKLSEFFSESFSNTNAWLLLLWLLK